MKKERKQVFSVAVKPSTIEKVDQLALDKGVERSVLVRAAIRFMLDNPEQVLQGLWTEV